MHNVLALVSMCGLWVELAAPVGYATSSYPLFRSSGPCVQYEESLVI